jgi:hypothetical protein
MSIKNKNNDRLCLPICQTTNFHTLKQASANILYNNREGKQKNGLFELIKSRINNNSNCT